MEKIKFDKSWLLFIAAAAVFLGIKLLASDYAISDENTYYKMGELVASGQVPYRDFFFAHYPLQIYLYAAVFKVFGFNFMLLKMLSAIATAIAAAFVFATAKEKTGSGAALGASALFLFSYGTLLFTNFPTGTELAIAFIAAALYCFNRGKNFTSGALLGLATATAQLSVLVFVMLGLFLFLKDRKRLKRLAAGFAIVFLGMTVILLAIAKGEFLKQTILYHLQKPGESVDKMAVFGRVLKMNAVLFITAAIALLSSHRKKLGLLIPAAVAGAYLALFPIMKTAFNYYLLYAFPFLAVMAGYGILALHSSLASRAKLRQEAATVVLAILVVLSSGIAVRQFNSYDFQDFAGSEEIADYVKENSMKGQTIFGDDSTVPLLSLLSGREVALNHVDNNALRYNSGITDLQATLSQLGESIKQGKLKFIITRELQLTPESSAQFGIATVDGFGEFVEGKCTLSKEFSFPWRGLAEAFKVYDCQAGTSPTA